jgi:hypothetical protein
LLLSRRERGCYFWTYRDWMDVTEPLSPWAKEAQIITLQMLPQQCVVWTPRQLRLPHGGVTH